MGLAQLAQGYAISDKGAGNYKLPLIFLVMLWPLIFHGAGRFSVDALFARLSATPAAQPRDDMLAGASPCCCRGRSRQCCCRCRDWP